MQQPTPRIIDDLKNGLSAAQAQARLAVDGVNELPGNGPRQLLVIARDVLMEPMFVLLLAAAAIYIALGEAREAIALSASLVAVIIVTVFQERRTENALAKLRDLSSPQALVVRDGIQIRIPSREVVVGDLIILSEGDRVSADGLLLSASALGIDESILTGESLPADKAVNVAEPLGPAKADNSNLVFSGSLVIHGYGSARVLATGARTEIGKIGGALITLNAEVTPLFKEVRRIVRWVASAGLLVCTLIAVIYGLTHQDWLGGILAGITVAMGILPEEFPVVLTVFLAMGAWRISQHGVLTRRMPAIESIGAATLLAVDKTGTLTENRMRVAVIDTLTSSFDLRQPVIVLDELANTVLHTALAASERDAFDPMEHAIQEAAAAGVAKRIQDFASMQLIREYDLTPELLAVTHVWHKNGEALCNVTVKGAPETMFELCHVDSTQRHVWLERVSSYARDGLRVLAVAQGEHAATQLPDSARDFKLTLLGLVCLADPLRADIPARLSECKQAGIRVVMITGDHAGTALAIAGQAGIDTAGGALTGAEVAALPAQDLTARTRNVNVYARMAPEQKLSLVQAFKANGEIVVMTGDGVNDAPALKAAHVGVAMGGRGTEVARAAASLVLVNDDFASLVSAVRLGRRIYQNIQHAMSFIIAVHIPIAGLGLLPVLFNWPLLLFPLHIMFLEFVVDPACSFVFEADSGSADLMRNKPRSPTASLFSKQTIIASVLRGVVVLLVDVGVYWLALKMMPEAQVRALTFSAMVVGSVLLIFVSRTHIGQVGSSIARNNVLLWWITAFSMSALALAVYVPGIARVFRFESPPLWAELAILFSCALIFVLPYLRRRAN
jgi:P-type Ca2+ transporter type 2C